MTALVLVDIQNDFLPEGSFPVHDGDQILPVVNELVMLPFSCIVATKDWHPANHGSFAALHNKQPGERIMLGGLEQILWPTHCVQNTPGAEFSPALDTSRIQEVFFKGTNRNIDSYSTFFDNGHRRSTGLGKYLKSKGVHTIYIAGLTTEYCVESSVRDAYDKGYRVFVIQDATHTIDEKSHQHAVENVLPLFSTVCTANAFLQGR